MCSKAWSSGSLPNLIQQVQTRRPYSHRSCSTRTGHPLGIIKTQRWQIRINLTSSTTITGKNYPSSKNAPRSWPSAYRGRSSTSCGPRSRTSSNCFTTLNTVIISTSASPSTCGESSPATVVSRAQSRRIVITWAIGAAEARTAKAKLSRQRLGSVRRNGSRTTTVRAI